jgi:hypothetical protein
VLTAALQTVSLFPPIAVHGHVYEPDGRPAAYAAVQATNPNQSTGSPGTAFTYADRAGKFVLRLPAYGRFDITATTQATNGFFITSQARATLDLRYGEISPEINLRLRAK